MLFEPRIRTITGIGQKDTMTVLLSNFSNVAGIEIELSFDPAVISVVDLNEGQAGVQIAVGNCPPPNGFDMDVDNEDGTIFYLAYLISPTPTCSNGYVTIITFECVNAGTSEVRFENAVVSDPDGDDIAHDLQNGSVVCQP